MVRGRRIGPAVAVSLAVLVLSGCSAQQPANTPPSTPVRHTATTGPVTQDLDSGPSTLFYTPCSSLVDVGALSDGLTQVAEGPAMWPAGVAAEQTGMLDCTWTNGEPSTGDTAIDPAVDVSAIPGARAAGLKDVAASLAASSGVSSLGVGDASAAECHADSSGLTCRASIVAGDVWVWVGLYGRLTKVPASSSDAAVAVLRAVSAGVVQNLGEPGPAWTAPATSWAPAPACSTLTADPRKALGDTAGSWRDWNEPGDDDAVRRYASFGAGWNSNCVWSNPSSPGGAELTLEIVPGGAWAWDRLADKSGITTHAIAVPGAEKAAYRCDDSNGYCYADAMADHTWFQVQFLTGGTTHEQQKLAAVLASVIASKA